MILLYLWKGDDIIAIDWIRTSIAILGRGEEVSEAVPLLVKEVGHLKIENASLFLRSGFQDIFFVAKFEL
jgi:hypothetical protein